MLYTLDELFSTMELHETRSVSMKEEKNNDNKGTHSPL